MQAFLIAVQFLTRVPVATKSGWLKQQPEQQEQQIAESVMYYPLVGLLMGILLWILGGVLSAVSPILVAALILMFWVFMSGGLHLDGLADSADAWAGGYGDREKSLQIMKDPAAGPLAVVVLAVLLIIKFAALTVLLELEEYYLLIAVPVAGRMSVIALLLTTAYVREQGLGSAMARHFNHSRGRIVLLTSFVLLFFLMPLNVFVVASVAAAGLLYFVRKLMVQRIDGMTGDTIGASIELVEAVALVAIAIAVSVQV